MTTNPTMPGWQILAMLSIWLVPWCAYIVLRHRQRRARR